MLLSRTSIVSENVDFPKGSYSIHSRATFLYPSGAAIFDNFYVDLPEGRPDTLTDRELASAVRILRKGNRLLKAETEAINSRLVKLGLQATEPEVHSASTSASKVTPSSSSRACTPEEMQGAAGMAARRGILNRQQKIPLVNYVMERCREEHQRFLLKASERRFDLKQSHESLQKTVGEMKEIVKDLVNWHEMLQGSRMLTGEKLAKYLESVCMKLEHSSRKISSLSSTMRRRLTEAQRQVKVRADLMKTLVAGDFEYMLIQNRNLKQDLDEKVQRILEVKSTLTECIEKVSHLRVNLNDKSKTLNNLVDAKKSKERAMDINQKAIRREQADLESSQETLKELQELVETHKGPTLMSYIEEKMKLEQLRSREERWSQKQLMQKSVTQTFYHYLEESKIEAVHKWAIDVFKDIAHSTVRRRAIATASYPEACIIKPTIVRFQAPSLNKRVRALRQKPPDLKWEL